MSQATRGKLKREPDSITSSTKIMPEGLLVLKLKLRIRRKFVTALSAGPVKYTNSTPAER